MLFEGWNFNCESKKNLAMKKKFFHNDVKDSPKQTSQPLNMKSVGSTIKVDDVKPWKDNYEHEKVRRQRQDLFDNWEHKEKNIRIRSLGRGK